MFDSYLIKKIERIVFFPAELCLKFNISANYITGIGLLLVIPLFLCVISGNWLLAFCFLLCNRFADGLDGVVARAWKERSAKLKSNRIAFKKVMAGRKKIAPSSTTASALIGTYFDIVADYVFYVSIPVGFAIYSPSGNALAAVILLCSFVLTSVTFLGFAVQAEKVGIVNEKFKGKGFYYFSGMVEGGETIFFFSVVLFFPHYFSILSFIFACSCVITALVRFLHGVKMLKS